MTLPGPSLDAVAKVAERPTGFKISNMLLPIGIISPSDFDSRSSKQLLRGDAGNLEKSLGEIGETQLLVTFPDPVRGHLRNVPEALLRATQCALCAFSVTDIDQNSTQFGRLTIFSKDRNDIAYPDLASVSREHAVFEVVIFTPLGGIDTNPDCLFPVIRMNDVGPEVLLIPILDRITEHIDRLRSDICEAHGCWVKPPGNDVQCLYERFETVLALPQSRLCPLAFRYVVDCEEQEHFSPDLHKSAVDENIKLVSVFGLLCRFEFAYGTFCRPQFFAEMFSIIRVGPYAELKRGAFTSFFPAVAEHLSPGVVYVKI